MAALTVSHVLQPRFTNTDSVNFLRVCHIVLDDIPEILRDIFKQEVQAKYNHNWTDTPTSGQWLLQQERCNSNLSQEQRQLLENGNTRNWNSTLLFHLLLNSNLHLLVNNPVPGVQINLDPSLNVGKVPPNAHVDLSEFLYPGSKVILDLGKDILWAEVTTVQRNQFNFRKPYPFPQSVLEQKLTADLWVCQPEWCAVEDLLHLCNHSFARHHSNAGISILELQKLLQDIESAYTALSRKPQVIAHMRAVGTEHLSSDTVAQKIQEYREQWTWEQHHYKQLTQQELYGVVDDPTNIVTQCAEKEKDDATSKQEVAKKNGEHSSALAVEIHKVEDGSLENNAANIPGLPTELTEVKKKMSPVEQTDYLHSHNKSKVKDHVDVIQTDNAATIDHITKGSKQVSLEQEPTGIRPNVTESEVSVTAWSERHLSDEVQRTTELVRNLSSKEEETAGHVLILNEQVHGIEMEVEKLKENVELMHQDSISEDPLRKLNPSHFESDISYYTEKHHPGTREWLFSEVNKWHQHTATDRNRNVPNICLVTGNPGMGKSVVAAKLCTMGEEKRILAGCFFFQHNKTRRSTPKMLVQTLTYQLSSIFPEFQEMVVDALVEMKLNSVSASELFTDLILEPLHQLPQDLPKMYIVIDALDECEFDSRNELLKLILREFIKLPKWISVILTSRPDQKILQRLRRIKPVIELIPDDPRNVNDITIFLRSILQEKIRHEEFEAGVELLVKKSEGMFLYFHYAVDTLVAEDTLTLSKLESLLPDGIDDYYDQNFQRLYAVLGKEKYQTLLQAIIAARADFPQGLVAPLLKISLMEATQIIETISVLLPAHNDHIHMFHKSVRDWLTDEELAGDYMVEPSSGHHHLAILCHKFFQDVKSDAPTKVQLAKNPTKRYVIENAVYHLCSASALKFSEQIVSTVEDLQYMYYRLILARGITEELIADYSQAKAALRGDLQLYQQVQNCEAFIKRYAPLLNHLPHLVLQCALNEPHMFSQRLRVQQYLTEPTRYFPSLRVYLEVTNKLQTSGSVLITYACQNSITNFVKTEEDDLLICSDDRGKLYFWNKQTAELVHEEVTSQTFFDQIKNLSISPDGKIAYGSINKVLTPDGNTVPLIPIDESDTNACIFSPDGKKLLAWDYYVDGVFKLMAEISMKFKSLFSVELWDLASCTHARLEVIQKKENRPYSACFSHSGSHIYCGHRNGRIVQWETTTGSPTAIMYTDGTVTRKGAEPLLLHEGPPRDDPVYHVNHSPNGYFFAACCNQRILIWDAAALYLLQTLPSHPGAATQHCLSNFFYCSFSDDSKHFVAGTSDGVLKTWRVESLPTKTDRFFVQEVSAKPEGSTAPIACCMFDKHLNIMCAIGSVVRIYSYEDLLFSTKVGEQDNPAVHPGTATTSAFLPDGENALTCGGNTLCLWHVPTKVLLASASCEAGHLIHLSSDGKLALTYGISNFIQLWETADGLRLKCTLMHQQQNQNIQPGTNSDDHEDMSSEEDICSCAVSNQAVVVGGTGNGLLYLWYGEGHNTIMVFKVHQPNLITWCEFSPDGQRFVSADVEGGIIMWQLIDGREKMEVNMIPLEGHEESIELVLFSPGQARRIASCSDDKTLHLYNGPSGDLVKKITGHDEAIQRIAWSLDGSMLASVDGKGQVNIWDGLTGELKQHLPIFTESILDVCFTYTDRYICTRDYHEGVIHIHDVTTGKQVSCLLFSAPICTVSSSTSPWIICGLKDASVKFIKLHSIAAQQEQQTDECIAHRGELQSMDGTILSIESLLEVRTALVTLDPQLWRSLGLSLKVENADLLAIASDNEGDVSQCLTEVIAQWLQNLSSPSWKSLAVATWNIDKKVAFSVAQNHQEGRFSRQISLGFVSEEDPLLQGIDHEDLGNNSNDVNLALLAGGHHLNLFHLGLVLGLSYGTLRSIWTKHRGDYRSCLIDIVADWLKWIDQVRVFAIGETCCSWKILVRALLHPLVRQRALAEKIAKDHK